MSGTERPACQAAIIQALRFHFRLRPKEIANKLDISRHIVSSVTTGSVTVLSWDEREFQDEAIEQAKKIVEN